MAKSKKPSAPPVKWEDIAVRLLNMPAKPKTPRKAVKKPAEKPTKKKAK